MRRERIVGDYVYHYQLVQGTHSFTQNVMGREFSGLYCLDGYYASEVINYAISRIRRPQ